MSDCNSQLLSSYIDDELDDAERLRVEKHVTDCPACAAEVRALRETSRVLKGYPFADISREELVRAHDAIESAADQPIWRLGFALGVIAASVLIVSCAWLMELSNPTAPAQNVSPQLVRSQVPAWERMATTLKPEPFRSMNGPDTAMGAGMGAMTDSRSRDTDSLDWMLNGLGSTTKKNNHHEEDAN